MPNSLVCVLDRLELEVSHTAAYAPSCRVGSVIAVGVYQRSYQHSNAFKASQVRCVSGAFTADLGASQGPYACAPDCATRKGQVFLLSRTAGLIILTCARERRGVCGVVRTRVQHMTYDHPGAIAFATAFETNRRLFDPGRHSTPAADEYRDIRRSCSSRASFQGNSQFVKANLFPGDLE